MRALLVSTISNKEQYIIQLQRKFLFFKWWETYKIRNNGIWHYGNGIFTKTKVEEIFKMIEEYCKQKGYEFSSEIIK